MFFLYVIRIHELVDALLIRRYNTLLNSFTTFVRKNLYKTIKLPGFSKNSYLKKRVYNVFITSMLTLDESSHVVDAEYGVGGKNKVTRVTWFSFGTLLLKGTA